MNTPPVAGLARMARRLTTQQAGWLALGLIVALIGFSCLCGYVGIDYGVHWDEGYQLEGLRACVDNLVFLPQKYIYGSVYFLVGLAVVLAHNKSFPAGFVHDLNARGGQEIIDLGGYPSIQKFQRVSHALIDSPRYLLENRMVFFVLSSLVILWVYLLVRKLHPGRRLAALAAAVFMAGSWEFQYHARFLAVDGVMAQVLTGELLLLACAWLAATPGSRTAWYVGAAISAGVALSCKATGLAAFLPVALFPLLHPDAHATTTRIGRAMLGVVVAGVTAILLQPGLLIDPLRVVAVLRRESWEYGRKAWDHPNLTTGIVDRVGSFLAWLLLAVPSPFVVVSAVASAIALAGLVAVARQHRRFSILGAVLIGALLFAMVSHPLMIVRHYLVCVPVMAVGFGIGVIRLHELLGRRPWVWRIALAALVVVGVVQQRWLYRAASSIRHATAETIAASAAADLLASPQPIRLSAAAYEELAPRLASRFQCTPAPASEKPLPVVIHVKEHPWRSNTLGLSRRFYGQRDVNYDWYASWIGHADHSPLMIVSARTARRQHVGAEIAGVCEPVPPGGR